MNKYLRSNKDGRPCFYFFVYFYTQPRFMKKAFFIAAFFSLPLLVSHMAQI